jgi:hypothetical protein
MDSLLDRFILEIKFEHDERILDLFRLHGIEYQVNNNIIYCKTKSLTLIVFVDNNIDIFSKLGDLVCEKGENSLYFSSGYYVYFSIFVFSLGNLEMIEFLYSKINFHYIPRDHFNYLGYRLDDSIEIVDRVINKLTDKNYLPFSDIAHAAMYANNINIFKYIYDNVFINTDTQLNISPYTKENTLWSTHCVEFLEFFLSKSLLSDKDIRYGIKIVNTRDKRTIVLSYVESGRLKLSCETIQLLNELVNKKLIILMH